MTDQELVELFVLDVKTEKDKTIVETTRWRELDKSFYNNPKCPIKFDIADSYNLIWRLYSLKVSVEDIASMSVEERMTYIHLFGEN